MWKSNADVLSDLNKLNDFGDPDKSVPFVLFTSAGRGLKLEKKVKKKKSANVNKFLDPRTGEEIPIDEELPGEDSVNKGRGRGLSLQDDHYSSLHKQIRQIRPLGSGDEAIMSYLKNKQAKPQDSAVPVTSSVQVTEKTSTVSSTSSCAATPKETKTRVKAVRNSIIKNNNALIMGLLKAKEMSSSSCNSETEKTPVVKKSESLVEINKSSSDHVDNATNKITQLESTSNDQLKWNNGKTTTVESLSKSENSTYDEDLNMKTKIKVEHCRSPNIASGENFNAESNFAEKGKNNALKISNEGGKKSFGMTNKQNVDLVEKQKKLEENVLEKSSDDTNQTACHSKGEYKTQNSQVTQNLDLLEEEFTYVKF